MRKSYYQWMVARMWCVLCCVYCRMQARHRLYPNIPYYTHMIPGGCWLPAQLFTVMWWETHWVKDVLDQSLAGCGCWLAWTQSQYLSPLELSSTKHLTDTIYVVIQQHEAGDSSAPCLSSNHKLGPSLTSSAELLNCRRWISVRPHFQHSWAYSDYIITNVSHSISQYCAWAWTVWTPRSDP